MKRVGLKIWHKRYYNPEVDFAFKRLATEEKKDRFGNGERKNWLKDPQRKLLRGQKWKCDKRPFGEINFDFELQIVFFSISLWECKVGSYFAQFWQCCNNSERLKVKFCSLGSFTDTIIKENFLNLFSNFWQQGRWQKQVQKWY